MVSDLLRQVYEKKGNWERALEMLEIHVKMKDSINNEENRKSSKRSQIKYFYEKKAVADSVRIGEEKVLLQAELENGRSQRNYTIITLLILLAGASYTIGRYRKARAQRLIIQTQRMIVEEQKNKIEEKQKEIIESMPYAQKIQHSLMPNHTFIKNRLKKLKD